MNGQTGYTLVLAIHPESGELVSRAFYESDADSDPLGFDSEDSPDLTVVFRVDRFLMRLDERMDDVLNGQQAKPDPNPTRGEDPDFFRRWTTDDAGRRVMVGLTHEESAEFETLAHDPALRRSTRPRYLDLHHKHESARHARLNAEIAAREAK